MALLEITDLKKSYVSPDGESLSVIDIPHFILEQGQQIALRGESGSGKTTFLNLIACILEPDSGQISLAGTDVSSIPESKRDRIRAEDIGYIFQTFNLLQSYSALENVMLGMMFGEGPDKKRAISLLQRMGLEQRINHLPTQLSIGQQQRTAVARALANNPKLILADEPTGNLDSRNKIEAVRLIRDVCSENNASLLLVSHDENVLSNFEMVEELSNINRAQLRQV